MCLDGPTFVATEGWDWIPAVRDRDTGIWQPVTLTATSTVKIGDRAGRHIAAPARHLARRRRNHCTARKRFNCPRVRNPEGVFRRVSRDQTSQAGSRQEFGDLGPVRIRATDCAASAPVVAERLWQARAVHPAPQPSRGQTTESDTKDVALRNSRNHLRTEPARQHRPPPPSGIFADHRQAETRTSRRRPPRGHA